MKPIIDNMPEKLTAHAIRRLCQCGRCRGMGDGEQMIENETLKYHTTCYVKKFGLRAVLALPRADLGKLRIRDLTRRQMQRLMDIS